MYTTRWMRALQHHCFDFDEKMLMHCREKENRIAMTRCYPGSLLLRAVSFRAVYTALRRYYAKAMPKFNSFERQSTGSYRGIADKLGIPSPPSACSVCPKPPTDIESS